MAFLYVATSVANDIAFRNIYSHSNFVIDDIYYVLLILSIVYFERKFCAEAFLHQAQAEESGAALMKMFNNLPDAVLLLKQTD